MYSRSSQFVGPLLLCSILVLAAPVQNSPGHKEMVSKWMEVMEKMGQSKDHGPIDFLKSFMNAADDHISLVDSSEETEDTSSSGSFESLEEREARHGHGQKGLKSGHGHKDSKGHGHKPSKGHGHKKGGKKFKWTVEKLRAKQLPKVKKLRMWQKPKTKKLRGKQKPKAQQLRQKQIPKVKKLRSKQSEKY